MRQSRSIKTELVISMTLAEIFLLMLFVVWYSVGGGAGPEWERIAKGLQQKIVDLEKQLQAKDARIADLEKIKAILEKAAPATPPATETPQVQIGNGNGNGTNTNVSQHGRSNLTAPCSERGLKDILFGVVIQGRDLYVVNGERTTFEGIQVTYAAELAEAKRLQCRHSVKVFYREGVDIDDYNFSLNRIRSVFYIPGKLGKS